MVPTLASPAFYDSSSGGERHARVCRAFFFRFAANVLRELVNRDACGVAHNIRPGRCGYADALSRAPPKVSCSVLPRVIDQRLKPAHLFGRAREDIGWRGLGRATFAALAAMSDVKLQAACALAGQAQVFAATSTDVAPADPFAI